MMELNGNDIRLIQRIKEDLENPNPLLHYRPFISEKRRLGIVFDVVDIAKANAFIHKLGIFNTEERKSLEENFGVRFLSCGFDAGDHELETMIQTVEECLAKLKAIYKGDNEND